jgi:coenzyme PQQ precursor peptide PqqA
MTKKAKLKKRTWSKPIVHDEQAGMEVTSYASAILRTS